MLEQMEAAQPGTSTLKDTASGERTQAQEDHLSKRLVLFAVIVGGNMLTKLAQNLCCSQVGSIEKLMKQTCQKKPRMMDGKLFIQNICII